MGQWAHRRRRGGRGADSAAPLIQITLAEHGDTDTINLEYSAPVTAGDFLATDFTTGPSAFIADNVNQTAPDVLELVFSELVDAESDITYSGATPGILTPQTQPLI